MKKINYLVLIVAIFLSLSIYSSNEYALKRISNKLNCDYYVYAYDKKDIENIKCGDYYIYKIKDNQTFFKNKFCEEINLKGNNKTINDIMRLLNIEVVKKFSDNGINIYGYSSIIKDYFKLEDAKVNIQIFMNDGKIKIATPLIIGYM